MNTNLSSKILLYYLIFTFHSIAAQSSFSSFINSIIPISSSAGRGAIIADYMEAITQIGTPIIENDTANFIYWDNEISSGSHDFNSEVNNIKLVGDFTDWGYDHLEMTNIPGTNFYYHSRKFEHNARLQYAFIINDLYWIPDPLNPRQVPTTGSTNSILSMPGYKEPWEVDYFYGINHGKLEELVFESETMNRQYSISVYLPSDYDEDSHEGYPSAYFQDGFAYIQEAKAVNIIDNMIANNLIQPIIAVFIQPTSRNEEYAFMNKQNYTDFFALELVKFIDQSFNTSQHPEDRLVLGISFGGNISALISYTYPDVFGNCGLQSSSMWPGEYETIRALTSASRKEINFYSVWGTYEYEITETNRLLKDEMINLGYNYEWVEYPEAHNWDFFRSTIDDLLIHFFPGNYTGGNVYEGELPDLIELSQNFPNPFNLSTEIVFYLPDEMHAKICLYNSLGESIEVLADDIFTKGKHKINFNGINLPSGVYYYSLLTSFHNIAKGMVLIK